MKTHRPIFAVLCILAVFAAPIAAQEPIPKQAPLVVIEGNFAFVPGTWAEYTVFDKVKNETSRLYIAALKRDTVAGRPGIWLEIEAEMEGTPVVVTDLFAEETKDGPGQIYKAVIQVKGMSPFTVPKKYLEGEDQSVGAYQPAQIVKRLEQKKVVIKGRTIDTLRVEAQDKDGRTTTASVSVQVPPLALVAAETDDLKMTLDDWGDGAASRISGQPIGFTFWIMEQIAIGLTKKK